MDLRGLQALVDGRVDFDEVSFAPKGFDEFAKVCGHGSES
jgi:hypothetical protein